MVKKTILIALAVFLGAAQAHAEGKPHAPFPKNMGSLAVPRSAEMQALKRTGPNDPALQAAAAKGDVKGVEDRVRILTGYSGPLKVSIVGKPVVGDGLGMRKRPINIYVKGGGGDGWEVGVRF